MKFLFLFCVSGASGRVWCGSSRTTPACSRTAEGSEHPAALHTKGGVNITDSITHCPDCSLNLPGDFLAQTADVCNITVSLSPAEIERVWVVNGTAFAPQFIVNNLFSPVPQLLEASGRGKKAHFYVLLQVLNELNSASCSREQV